MDARTALIRAAELAQDDVLPLAQRVLGGARRSAEELALKLLGAEFETRVDYLRERYEQRGGDPFGLDPDTAKYAVAVCAIFHRLYFRTDSHGLHHVPPGRALLVANHSGQLPIDAAIIGCTMFLDASSPRVMRAMVDKWTQRLPFVSTFFSRVGQVVGVRENARRLLEMDEMLLVFPEGVKGIAKPITRRYQLEEFGLGFMRLALETNTPIVPVAVIGAEEQYVSLGNLSWAARALRMPVFPLLPQMLIPGAQLPLPTKYRIYFGEPMRFEGDPDDDDASIENKVWVVREAIQAMLQRGLRERRHVFF
jgi:1-acyl-sn-glycerol-3-phosphate acyltransferase